MGKYSERYGEDPRVLVGGHVTFYAKRWQQNDYYPLFKYVWNAEVGKWEEFIKKFSGWYSWGYVGGDDEWLVYRFEHNAYKLSRFEMFDSKHWDFS